MRRGLAPAAGRLRRRAARDASGDCPRTRPSGRNNSVPIAPQGRFRRTQALPLAEMARLPRSTFPEYGVWHATTRGVERRKVYLDRDDGREFLAQLWRAVDRFRLDVYALCLMPNHYHFVVECPRDLLSRALHRVNGRLRPGVQREIPTERAPLGRPLRALAGARRRAPRGDVRLRAARTRSAPGSARAPSRVAVELEPLRRARRRA